MKSPPPEVAHDEAGRRFVVMIDGHLAHADYQLDGERMICTHTFVPPELRGHGLAEHLVRAALAEARQRGWRVVPACSYVAAFIERHREFHDLLEK
jgi:predicted GNAT family acetyltransferase